MADNRDIVPETLSNFRITFEAHPERAALEELPESVRTLREALQSWKGRVIKEYLESKNIKKKLQVEDIPEKCDRYADNIDINLDKPSEIVKRLNADVDGALDIVERTSLLRGEHAQEDRWRSMLLETVFYHLTYRKPPASGYWSEFNLGSPISLQYEHEWNEYHGIEKTNDCGPDLTRPKPDIYLGLPIHKLPLEDPCGFWRDGLVQNFSLDTLGILLNKGLVCTPTTGVRKYMQSRGQQRLNNEQPERNESPTIEPDNNADRKFSKEHLLCFPWAIVELKKEFVRAGEVTKCYCQGANAASRALRMFEILSRYADTVDGEQIPPVIVLTFIGPIFKLWIAFSTRDRGGSSNYKMICIEEQSIATFWGALRLYQIVNDMSFWATRILKPKISMYIDQWRLRHIHGFRLDISRDSVLSEIVQKVEEREREIGLSGSSNLAEIVRMALIIREMPSINLEVRCDGGVSPQINQAKALPNQFTTPVSHSNLKTATGSTKGGKASRASHGKTPSRSGGTKSQSRENLIDPPAGLADLENIFGQVPQRIFIGTGGITTITSPANSTTTKVSSSSSNPFTLPQTPSFGAADLRTNKTSTTSAGTSKTRAITVGNNGVKTINGQSGGLFTEFLTAKFSATRLEDLDNDRTSVKGSTHPSEPSNVSIGGYIMGNDTNILDSKWESDDDESMLEIIEDIRLFLWPEEL